MKTTRRLAGVLLFTSLVQMACAMLSGTEAPPPAPTEVGATQAGATAPADPSAAPSVEPSEAASAATATSLATAVPVATREPTAAPLRLEVVQTQLWIDRNENVRVNALLRNPYDFPIAPGSGARADLMDGAGEVIQDAELYFLDGISGGGGFILPGETIAAHACFNCEQAPITEAWEAVEIVSSVKDATNIWNYFTEVEPTLGDVTFEADSPLFWINGTVKNNSGEALARISVRVIVLDEAGKLVGAAEASAWDVPEGAEVPFDSYGIGETQAGPVTYEVTALGVNY